LVLRPPITPMLARAVGALPADGLRAATAVAVNG
jgi:hypothetical protein